MSWNSVLKRIRKVWKITARALTRAEIAEAEADKAEAVLLKEKQEQDQKVEDEGKAVVEDAPPPSTAPPIMGSIDGAKRRRNHTINYRELAGMQKRSRD
jgi:hypothetical protein